MTNMFEQLFGNLGNVEELAARVGVSPEQFQGLAQSLQGQLAAGTGHAEALRAMAAQHGLSLESLQGAFAEGGALAGLGSMLDRDGDGNPLNDITGFAQNLFKRS